MLPKLRSAVAERWRVVRRVYWRPATKVIGSVYAAVGLLSALTSEFASTSVQKTLTLGNRIPHWSAWEWATVGLGLLVVLGIEGATREVRRLDSDHENQLIELRAEIPAPLAPLKPRYEQREPYRHQINLMVEHRIGIRNPEGNPEATGVRVEWRGMAPLPAVYDARFLPEFPDSVPRQTGGDARLGISLRPGQEEQWVMITTGAAADGQPPHAAPFGPNYGPWRGLPWSFEPGGQWRLTYAVVANGAPDVLFSVVVTATDGELRCDLED